MYYPTFSLFSPHMRFWLILLFLFLGAAGVAQQMNLRNWSVEAGLGQSQVYAILQDNRGALWAGTRGGGVSIFDGINFTNLTSKDGLPNNFVRCLTQDMVGNIWIGTDEGLCVHNGFEIISLPLPKDKMAINQILFREDKLCIASDKGLWEWTLGEKQPRKISLPEPYANVSIQCLYVDPKNNLWCGTDDGIFIWNDPHFSRITTTQGLGNNLIRSIVADRKGRIWVATYGAGVSWADQNEQTADSLYVFRKIDEEKGLCDNIVVSIMEDKLGRMWFATVEGGACRLDDHGFTQFSESQGLGSNHARAFVEDFWGNIWIATSGGGISRFGGDRFTHLTPKSGLNGERVYAVKEDAKGSLWLGTSSGGITQFVEDTFYTFKKSNGLSDAIVKSIFVEDQVWVGTEGDGLYRLDSADIFRFGFESGIDNLWIKDILRDSDGFLWVATAGGGLAKEKRGKEIAFNSIRKKNGLPSDRYLSLLQGEDKMIWAGSSDAGIVAIRGETGIQVINQSNGLCSDEVRDMVFDSVGNLWVATSGGLSMLKPGSNKAICFRTEAGLSSENIYQLIYNKERNLLMLGSEKGLDLLWLGEDQNIKQVRHYGEAEGFLGIETCTGATFESQNGGFWFGTMKGATHFNLMESVENRISPYISLTRIRVGFEEANEIQNSTGRIPFSNVPAYLRLPHDKNMLSFQFMAINLGNPEKVKYASRMYGLSEIWSQPSQNREAIYSNLNPGKYVFEVKACNEDGIWNEVPSRFAFEILPPWWATWWFRSLAILILSLSLYFIFWLRLRQVRKEGESARKKLEFEMQVLELEHKALRLQMNPHFIFNALNSIKGFIALNDSNAARQNIVKFARLMRLILDNSRTQWISIEKEIQTLELYLELEKLNRNGSFQFFLNCDSAINQQQVFIPPMMLQPFVENAVIHGGGSLPSGGNIYIRIFEDEQHIRCEIEDNGKGISPQTQMGLDNATHKSAGLEVTLQRLKMMDASLTVSFSKPESGQGTLVKINIPFRQ